MIYISYILIFLIGIIIGAIWEQERNYKFYEKNIESMFNNIIKKLQEKSK
jgi:hypothetical protein